VSRPRVLLREKSTARMRAVTRLCSVDIEEQHQGGGDGGASAAQGRAIADMQPTAAARAAGVPKIPRATEADRLQGEF